MNAVRPIRVLLVDDQTLVRQGIRSLLTLAAQVEVVAEAADGIEALAAIEETRPDVVLLDLRMPRLNWCRDAQGVGGAGFSASRAGVDDL